MNTFWSTTHYILASVGQIFKYLIYFLQQKLENEATFQLLAVVARKAWPQDIFSYFKKNSSFS